MNGLNDTNHEPLPDLSLRDLKEMVQSLSDELKMWKDMRRSSDLPTVAIPMVDENINRYVLKNSAVLQEIASRPMSRRMFGKIEDYIRRFRWKSGLGVSIICCGVICGGYWILCSNGAVAMISSAGVVAGHLRMQHANHDDQVINVNHQDSDDESQRRRLGDADPDIPNNNEDRRVTVVQPPLMGTKMLKKTFDNYDTRGTPEHTEGHREDAHPFHVKFHIDQANVFSISPTHDDVCYERLSGIDFYVMKTKEDGKSYRANIGSDDFTVEKIEIVYRESEKIDVFHHGDRAYAGRTLSGRITVVQITLTEEFAEQRGVEGPRTLEFAVAGKDEKDEKEGVCQVTILS